jgi:hypothetical protein
MFSLTAVVKRAASTDIGIALIKSDGTAGYAFYWFSTNNAITYYITGTTTQVSLLASGGTIPPSGTNYYPIGLSITCNGSSNNTARPHLPNYTTNQVNDTHIDLSAGTWYPAIYMVGTADCSSAIYWRGAIPGV